MGFGSGGGGFTPSPNNVPGSTITGTDKDSDTHQITGSVDITGSLQINGVQITQNGGGGGGGSPGGANTQVQFNNNGSFGGSANFTFDGNTITVSDDSDIAAKIGRVNIGAVAGGTADYAYFSHRDQASTNNYALQQRADGTTIVNAPSAGSLSLRLGQQNCLVVDGARNNNIGINGNPEARLHVSANTNEKDVFRADGDINNILYVSGSGKVGIGTGTPESTLEVRSTSTQQKWSYDDDNEFTVTVGDNGETVLAVSGAVGASPASDLVFDVSKGGDVFIRRQGDRLRFSVSTGTTNIQTDNAGTDLAFVCHPAGGLGNINTEIARFDNSGAGALLMSGTISTAGGDAPINFRDTATNIHSPGSNRLAITAPTLEVSGNLAISGAFGSSRIETITADGIISADTGLTLIDASSSLAVNNTLQLQLADGTFAGQEKKIRGIIKSGSTGNLSTGINIGGANIDSPPFLGGQGSIVLSSSFLGGPSYQRAGCSLVWDGTKWLPVGNYNFNINSTGF